MDSLNGTIWNISDWNHCHLTWKSLQGPCPSPDCGPDENGDPTCDCMNGETVMTNIGYVYVARDGDVVAAGRKTINVSR